MHQKTSESSTSLKLHSAQLCIFRVSLKVWFDSSFDVIAVFCCINVFGVFYSFFFLVLVVVVVCCGGRLGLFMSETEAQTRSH